MSGCAALLMLGALPQGKQPAKEAIEEMIREAQLENLSVPDAERLLEKEKRWKAKRHKKNKEAREQYKTIGANPGISSIRLRTKKKYANQVFENASTKNKAATIRFNPKISMATNKKGVGLVKDLKKIEDFYFKLAKHGK